MSEEKNSYYHERHSYWQSQAISQLSVANNFMLTISIGLLAFCFDKESFSNIQISFDGNISISLTLYFFSLLFLTISIFYGIIVLLTRLYDFRITRNIVRTRYKCSQQNEGKHLPTYEFEYPSFFKRTLAVFRIITNEMDLITIQENMMIREDERVLQKFNELRELSFVLGTISWRFPRLQILFFLIATILYVFSLFCN